MPTASSSTRAEAFVGWQRWTPGALRTEPNASQPSQTARAQESKEVIERRAYAAAFAQGKQAGFEAGRADGLALAQAEAARIAQVAGAAQAALQALGETLSHKTMSLAIAIAQKVMQREIQSCPESLLDIVRDALTLLPDGEQRVRIIVNTDDLELVRAALPNESNLPECSVAGSDEVARGGCRIVSPSGEIDATLQMRVSRVLEALGVHDEQPL